jgi:hypothetical protein
MNEVAERMRDMPTKLSRLFSVMQKLRDLPLFSSPEGTEAAVRCCANGVAAVQRRRRVQLRTA